MRLGACIDSRTPVLLWQLDVLGVSAVSVRLAPHGERTRQLLDLVAIRDSGRDILGVIDASSFTNPLDWRDGTDTLLDYLDDLISNRLVTHVVVGREWDDGITDDLIDDPQAKPRGGYGSWVLSAADLAELVNLVSDSLGPSRTVSLLLGGICSGYAEVLRGVDLSRVDGVCVHPYGSGVDTEGDAALNAHLDQVQAEIALQGQAGLRVLIGELGRSDQEVSREVIADWFKRTLVLLDTRRDIDAAFIYADSDRWAPGYGQFDQYGQPKPSVPVITDLSTEFVSGGPLVVNPIEEADEQADDFPEPSPSWVDTQLTPAVIAHGLSGSAADVDLEEAITALWGTIWPWLELYGLTENMGAKIALLAAVWVQTDGWLTPQLEGGSYDRLERLYGPGSPSASLLGNRYHGDGYRYHGRGLVPLRGRAAYAHYGQLLDLPLEDEPDLLSDPTVAAGALVMLFVERELFDAAARGDLFAIWSALTPGRTGYSSFAQAVFNLWSHSSGATLHRVEPDGEDETMWRERYEAAMEEVEALSETLYAQQRKLQALGPPPELPSDKDTKKTWVESGRLTRRWQEHAIAVVQDTSDMLGGLADGLIKIGLRPTEQEAAGGREEEEQQQQQQQEQEQQ